MAVGVWGVVPPALAFRADVLVLDVLRGLRVHPGLWEAPAGQELTSPMPTCSTTSSRPLNWAEAQAVSGLAVRRSWCLGSSRRLGSLAVPTLVQSFTWVSSKDGEKLAANMDAAGS